MMPAARPRTGSRTTDLVKTRNPVDVLSLPEEEVLHLDSLLGFTGVGVEDQGVAEEVVLAINSTSMVLKEVREETRASEGEVEEAGGVSNLEDLNQARKRP